MRGRTTGPVLAVVVSLSASLSLAGCGDADGRSDARPVAEAAGEAAGEAADVVVRLHPSAVPTAITCPGDQQVAATLDVWVEMGFPSVEEAVAPWVDPAAGESTMSEHRGGRLALAYVLRPDGTANMVVVVRRSSLGWLADTFRSCPEDAPGLDGRS